MNKKITVNLAVAIAIIAMTVTFSVTMLLSMRMFDSTSANVREKETMYNKIAEIDRTVRADYYGEINEETLRDLLAAGYMTGTGDRYAAYYSVSQYNDWREVQTGQVVGIGVDVAKDASGYARVIRVYPGSPAADIGLTTQTYITRIGENDVRSLSLSQINTQLRGESGTSVTITALDRNTAEEQTAELQRRQYDMPTVYYSVPEGEDIGYVQITTFNDQTADELSAAAEALKGGETPVRALVIDVRNNDGGSLDSALDAIDVLCPVGPIASRLEKDGSTRLLDTSDNQEIGLPVAVLVNANTTAGAELFATSVRDFGIGRIVGVTTAGKGSIQCDPVPLSDGSAIVYTVGMLLTKNGESFDGTGVIPDVEVLLTADQEAAFYDFTVDTDPQIVKAFETAASLLNAGQSAGGETAESASESTSGSAPAESTSASAPAESTSESAPAESTSESAPASSDSASAAE